MVVWKHGAQDRRAGSGDRIEGGRWAQRNQGDQDVRVGEVFVECAEKTGVSGLGFSGQGDNPALRGRRRLPEENMQLPGSKDGGWVHAGQDPGVQNSL